MGLSYVLGKDSGQNFKKYLAYKKDTNLFYSFCCTKYTVALFYQTAWGLTLLLVDMNLHAFESIGWCKSVVFFFSFSFSLNPP